MANTIIPSSQELALQSTGNVQNAIFNNTWFLFFESIASAIRGALGLRLGGILNSSLEAVGNSGSTATDLISYNLPKNILNKNRNYLEIEAWGSYASNSNNKTVELYFGSQLIFTTSAIAANNTSWSFTAKIIAIDAISQEIIVEAIFNNTVTTTITTGTRDSTNIINIKCIGTGIATNDIVQKALIVKLTPYD